EATIIVSYPSSQCIIQASWNWPFGRKDMEIYGESGYIVAADSKTIHLRNAPMKEELVKKLTSKDIKVYEDPFSYFFDVIRGKVKMTNYDPYCLTNNMTVVKILDAARESAKTGRTIQLQ
ncbi:MAG: gfo/Idh/MocA family oxidoreductase, partial [Bacteroidales bacterium]